MPQGLAQGYLDFVDRQRQDQMAKAQLASYLQEMALRQQQLKNQNVTGGAGNIQIPPYPGSATPGTPQGGAMPPPPGAPSRPMQPQMQAPAPTPQPMGGAPAMPRSAPPAAPAAAPPQIKPYQAMPTTPQQAPQQDQGVPPPPAQAQPQGSQDPIEQLQQKQEWETSQATQMIQQKANQMLTQGATLPAINEWAKSQMDVLDAKHKAEVTQANIFSEMRNRDIQRKQEQQKIDLQRKKDADAGKNSLTPEGRDLMDELGMRDSSFMSRMGIKNITERNRVINDWAKAGKTADDVMSARIGTKASTREAQSLAAQKAGLERVEKAITMKGGIGDQVAEAAKKIDPSKFRAYNKVSQFLQKEQSDPDLAAYKVRLIALRDEFATVINKGGVPTEGSRAQATEMMDAYAPNAVSSIVQAIKEVVGSNRKAIDDSLSGVGITAAPAGGENENTVHWDDLK